MSMTFTIIKQILLSLGAGFILGLIYTHLFLSHRRSIFTLGNKYSHYKQSAYSVLFALLRFGLLTLSAWYFLTIPSLNVIIVILSFLVTFWLLVLKYKAFSHEGH